MIRQTSRPPTARCTLPMYIGFLLSEPNSATCTRLAAVMEMSHDSVNRFLSRENYEPRDLFNEASRQLNLKGGTVNVDDSTLDKPYSHQMELVGHFWSGKHHRVVKGINLITLYYTDPQGRSLPINYRIYDKAEGKTKNDYYLDMLAEALSWGLEPAFATGDSWYSCVNNLKTVKNHRMGFLFAVESNRLVSIEKGQWSQVKQLEVPADGLAVWLRQFGEVKLFRTQLKDQLRHYVVYLPDGNDYSTFNQQAFLELHDQHWQIEQYHRMIKQVCNIERFQVRRRLLIRNHIFAAICGFVHLRQMQLAQLFDNAYQWQRDLFTEVVSGFVSEFVQGKEHLNPQFRRTVNA